MESFIWPSTRKKLPGKHGQQDLIASLTGTAETPNPFQHRYFLNWHGFRSVYSEPRAWESLAVRDDPLLEAWEGFCPRIKFDGRTTDGEYASRRTCAADDAATADGCRRQQRRERQHQRLQGRPVAVFRIFELGRPRRQLRRP